ncbi:DUF2934 domain-containing protein [Bradyrhizobium sp. B117]|uniref:DUF2934 domain-containing protein n=1 Tax=Bradyrhizobium sp. B117 TaxID=3140246 RepID=UPI003183A9D9
MGAAQMDERAKLEHQIELATKVAGYIRDQSTASRLRRFADELRQRLFPSTRDREIKMRAQELWEHAGRPVGRDLDFWLEAERGQGAIRRTISLEDGAHGRLQRVPHLPGLKGRR